MRRIREITAEEERFRGEPFIPGRPNMLMIRRDPVQAEPIGTVLLVPMRVVGYDPDCDGSLMARLEMLSLDEIDSEIDAEIRDADVRTAQSYGVLTHHGLFPTTGIVATADEIRALLAAATTPEEK